ncbi:MAG: alpha/beta hydrolase [Bacteroidota bacterium]
MEITEYSIENTPAPQKINKLGLVREWKSILQVGNIVLNYKSLVKNKQGNGQQVVLVPGWLSPATTMFPVKHFLKQIGYAPEYWSYGINNGRVEEYKDKLVAEWKNHTEPITMIGWSLGGLIAREVAREIPEVVSSVVTYGTPVKGGPTYTIGADVYGEEVSSMVADRLVELDKDNPIRVPLSIIFSKNDNFVSWPACIDETSKNAKHYEVKSTHTSLGIDPKVWTIIAQHLKEFA